MKALIYALFLTLFCLQAEPSFARSDAIELYFNGSVDHWVEQVFQVRPGTRVIFGDSEILIRQTLSHGKSGRTFRAYQNGQLVLLKLWYPVETYTPEGKAILNRDAVMDFGDEVRALQSLVGVIPVQQVASISSPSPVILVKEFIEGRVAKVWSRKKKLPNDLDEILEALVNLHGVMKSLQAKKLQITDSYAGNWIYEEGGRGWVMIDPGKVRKISGAGRLENVFGNVPFSMMSIVGEDLQRFLLWTLLKFYDGGHILAKRIFLEITAEENGAYKFLYKRGELHNVYPEFYKYFLKEFKIMRKKFITTGQSHIDNVEKELDRSMLREMINIKTPAELIEFKQMILRMGLQPRFNAKFRASPDVLFALGIKDREYVTWTDIDQLGKSLRPTDEQAFNLHYGTNLPDLLSRGCLALLGGYSK